MFITIIVNLVIVIIVFNIQYKYEQYIGKMIVSYKNQTEVTHFLISNI